MMMPPLCSTPITLPYVELAVLFILDSTFLTPYFLVFYVVLNESAILSISVVSTYLPIYSGSDLLGMDSFPLSGPAALSAGSSSNGSVMMMMICVGIYSLNLNSGFKFKSGSGEE